MTASQAYETYVKDAARLQRDYLQALIDSEEYGDMKNFVDQKLEVETVIFLDWVADVIFLRDL